MQGFQRNGDKLLWERAHESLSVEPWGQDSLRVRATLRSQILMGRDWALLPPAPCSAQIEIGAEQAVIRNGALSAEVSANGKLRFLHTGSGRELLAEAAAPYPAPPQRTYKPVGGDHFRLEVGFKAYDDERLYGLGQHQHGRLNQKGCVLDLLQLNTQVSIPFLLSSRGYGFLWNNPAVGRVELAYNGTRWIAEATPQLDYWVTAGDTPAAIMEHYADVTGHPPPLPPWAAGFWQASLRYRSQAEVMTVARAYRQRQLPLDVIVIDFFHWTMQGDWQFDPVLWPDPAGMVRELAELGIRLKVSVWPTVNALSPNFDSMQRQGLLVRTSHGVPAHMLFEDTQPPGRIYVHYYDPTNPAARKFIWDKVRDGYYRHGIKIWWLDACEPEMKPMDPENLEYHLGPGLAVTNVYPLTHQIAFYDGMVAEGETEILTFCRSAWAGSQRYGAAVWSGDIWSTFECLQAQVPAGLNMGLSGIPWWTTDIGGPFGGDITTPYFRELVVRWFQYSAFCPLFRLHGMREPLPKLEALPGQSQAQVMTGGPNEVWSFGEEAYAIIKDVLALRERLRPYLMAQMQRAHEKGIPPMRPLFFDFPTDAAAVEIEDQFMLGPDVLVAPILHRGARSRPVYLPAGLEWTDAWTGAALHGGQWLEAAAPLERIPVYLRAGATVPINAAAL